MTGSTDLAGLPPLLPRASAPARVPLITVVQPLIWLLLFGALFKGSRRSRLSVGSYLDYLTPGVVVMLAVSSAGWTGMGSIEDMSSGVMDQMLVSPAWRGALNLGSVAQCGDLGAGPDGADRGAWR